MEHFPTELSQGHFSLGVNYWASHAGPFMWQDWDESIVRSDLALLSEGGHRILRVFPLWPDFQPISNFRTIFGQMVEVRLDRTSLQGNGSTINSLSEVMISHFLTLLDIAENHDLKVIVSLINGWMSGRLFVPPALEGLDPIAHPVSVMWQTRFVREIVGRIKDHATVIGYDLGNECNCMGQANKEEAWIWTATISHAVRASDPSRPIISGMHSLSIDPAQAWSIRDQGELTDILTTHPYPLFTPYCHQESFDTFRPLLHSTAETRLYADISGRRAFVEEFGNLGPMVCGDNETANAIKAILMSLLAHDCGAALWWCAFDQQQLERPPHQWLALETELGLFRSDGTKKPIQLEMEKFSIKIASILKEPLPLHQREAVCILTKGQDSWAVAFSAFLLSKQAGFDIQFQYSDQPLIESNLYLLPSLFGHHSMSRSLHQALLEKVESGAHLYLSLGDAILRDFNNLTGMRVAGRHLDDGNCTFTFLNSEFEMTRKVQHQFVNEKATVLAIDTEGVPILSENEYGQGKVLFCALPIEQTLAEHHNAFRGTDAPPWYEIYKWLAKENIDSRVIRKSSPTLGMTEHIVSTNERIVIFINYSSESIHEALTISSGWRRVEDPKTSQDTNILLLAAYDSAIWRVVHE